MTVFKHSHVLSTLNNNENSFNHAFVECLQPFFFCLSLSTQRDTHSSDPSKMSNVKNVIYLNVDEIFDTGH